MSKANLFTSMLNSAVSIVESFLHTPEIDLTNNIYDIKGSDHNPNYRDNVTVDELTGNIHIEDSDADVYIDRDGTVEVVGKGSNPVEMKGSDVQSILELAGVDDIEISGSNGSFKVESRSDL